MQTENLNKVDISVSSSYGFDMEATRVMGVLNVTPDSFSDGGEFMDVGMAVSHALQMEEDGADIIDVGGESSRPGADPISVEEELDRIIPVIDGIRRNSQVLISVDTIKSRVADSALQVGANWINDISGLRSDPDMVEVARSFDCPVVVMHMKGNPQTMQQKPSYDDVINEINIFFRERIESLTEKGISKLVLDPGIGFGKRLEDNLELIKQADKFKGYGYPVLFGPSRKSFLGAITDQDENHRLAGTLAAVQVLVQRGVNILRVHDVRETRDFLKVMSALEPPPGS